MNFTLPDLPFAKDALAPHISKSTLEYHHGKHHAGYIKKLNDAIEGTGFEDAESLEYIITNASGKIYNLAAQAWNHEFYWNCLSPEGGGDAPATVVDRLSSAFESVEGFKEQFREAALNEFGSGWAWLMRNKNGQLEIDSTTDAINPISRGKTPLLTLDVWEHSYYLDYQNARADYVDAFLAYLINWNFLEKQLSSE